MGNGWLRAYLATTRPPVWSDESENSAYRELFERFASSFIRPEMAHALEIEVLRSVSYEVARTKRAELHTVIMDLSLMPVMELLTRLMMSPLHTRQLQFSLSGLFANRLAAHGYSALAFIAAKEANRRRARLPNTSPAEDAFFATSATQQLLFAFAHELAHCADRDDNLLLRLSREEAWEWWQVAMDPYRDRIEGRLSSGNLEWLDRLPSDAIGVLPEDELADYAAQMKAATARQKAEGALMCHRPVFEVMDALLTDPRSPLAEEVLCDAIALRLLCVHMPLRGTTFADRVEAAIGAGRNLALLRRIEEATRVVREDHETGLQSMSDTLVRARLLALLGQSLLRGITYEEFGESEQGLAILEKSLSAQDLIHERADRLTTAADLWFPAHLQALLAHQRRAVLATELQRDLPTKVEKLTELLRPSYRARVDEHAGAPESSPLHTRPNERPELDLAMGPILRDRVAPGTPIDVTTTSLPESSVRHRGWRMIQRSLRQRLPLDHALSGDQGMLSLAATALSAARWVLQFGQPLRPFAICVPNDRDHVDFLHPMEEGDTEHLRERLWAAVAARARNIDLSVIVCGGSSTGTAEDTVLAELWRPAGKSQATIAGEYRLLRNGGAQFVRFHILSTALDDAVGPPVG